ETRNPGYSWAVSPIAARDLAAPSLSTRPTQAPCSDHSPDHQLLFARHPSETPSQALARCRPVRHLAPCRVRSAERAGLCGAIRILGDRAAAGPWVGEDLEPRRRTVAAEHAHRRYRRRGLRLASQRRRLDA